MSKYGGVGSIRIEEKDEDFELNLTSRKRFLFKQSQSLSWLLIKVPQLMRKPFSYMYYNQDKDLATLMNILTIAVSRLHLGVSELRIDK